ncbi:MAG: flagellar basal body-associated FliL family protein [Fimbriimonadaceae bacterium]|nr:flagellar basal body-associated FliL family protein [Fimbriimonadaceae bacterium]
MAENPSADVAAPKKKNPLMAVLLLAVVVGPLAVGGMMMSKKQKAMQAQLEKQYEDDPPEVEVCTWPMPVQTVNLADGNRYARIKLELAFELDPVDAKYFRTEVSALSNPEGAKEGGGGGHGGGEAEPAAEGDKKAIKKEPGQRVKNLLELLHHHQSELNDLLIDELSGRTFETMLRPNDKRAFKDALVKRFGHLLTEVKMEVHDIYFSEFVMQ